MYADFVLSVTPTKDRQGHLEAQYFTFLKNYEIAQSEGKPGMAWVIVDETKEPAEFFQQLNDPNVVYIHLPDRKDLSTVPAEYQQICRDHLYSEEHLRLHIDHIQQDVCDRVKGPLDYSIPTIGEMRNIAIAIGKEVFAPDHDDFTIFTRDDDDFTSANLIQQIHEELADGSVFVKPASSLIYSKPSNEWWLYSLNNEMDDAVQVGGGEKNNIGRYVVWNDAAETQESEYGQLEMTGTFFSYRYSAWKDLSDKREADGNVPGGFQPTSWREDHMFARELFAEHGLEKVTVIDNDPADFVRLYGANTSKVIIHAEIDEQTVPEDVQEISRFLALNGDKPEKYAEITPPTSGFTPANDGKVTPGQKRKIS